MILSARPSNHGDTFNWVDIFQKSLLLLSTSTLTQYISVE